MVRIESELSDLITKYKIGPFVKEKMQIASHFMWKEHVSYYSLHKTAEDNMLSILSRCHDTGVNTYFHEIFSEHFALVFDLDSKDTKLQLKGILATIYETIRDFFEVNSSDIYCIVFSACSDEKTSYHIHFPDIVVNKLVCKGFYESIFKKDKKLRDVIDEQIVGSGKLRMPFSDKWDSTKMEPVGRKLVYYGSFNNRCQRFNPQWECDTFELLTKSCVRREPHIEITSMKVSIADINFITMASSVSDDSVIDLGTYDERDFSGLPDIYYSMSKMQIIIDYISKKYQLSANLMCSKIVRYMNNFVCMLTDMPGKVIFMLKKYNTDRKNQKWSFVQKSSNDFLIAFQHIKVLVFVGDGGSKAICKSVGEIWMKHNEKKTLSTIVFDPRPDSLNSNNLNIYQGMDITVQECKRFVEERGLDYKKWIEPILNHIREIWCSDNRIVYNYVLKWMAHAITKPWIKMGVALVLVGSEGCGKSMIVNALGKCFGAHYHQLTDMDDLVGRFTAPLADKMFVFADEAFWGGCKSVSGKLKGIITEGRIRCEHKGFDTYWVDNFANFIFASNHWHAVPAGLNARRYCCLGCTSKYNNKPEYFTGLYDCMYQENMCGLKCLVHYFATDVDIENFQVTKVPMTSLLRSQKENSFDTLESWWDQVLHRGYILTWENYEALDPTFQRDEKETPGLVRYFAGCKFGYQMLPLQETYNQYVTEMKGAGKVFHFQRFKQFLRDKNSYKPCQPPRKDRYRDVWVCFKFKECRAEWRKAHNDPDMMFENDLNVENDWISMDD